MGAILSAIGKIALELGLFEASKLLNEFRTLKTHQAVSIANEIIAKAEKKGAAYLTKALNAINNVPQMAGSPAVQQKMAEARRRAENNYAQVEQKVTDMKLKASQDAAAIQAMPERSVISTTFDTIKSGKTQYKQAQEFKDKAIQNIDNYDINVETKV